MYTSIYIVATVSVEPEIVSLLRATVRELPVITQMVQETTASDSLLQKVIHYYLAKWSQTCLDKDFQHFCHQKIPLSLVNGSIIFGECGIIPFTLRNRVLKEFHFRHQYIRRMKALACSYIYHS